MNLQIKVTPLKDWAIVDHQGHVVGMASNKTTAQDMDLDLDGANGYNFVIASTDLEPSQIVECMNDMKLSCEFRYQLI